jgi:CheY-like chemotaxis protein
MGRPEPQPQQKQKASVLVVDDSLDHVRSLALLFETMGYRVEYAINATTAVGIATRLRPDIIFLDLLLPDGHGAEICKELRSSPELAHTRIFGISASGRLSDHQRALHAGCDDVLRKPVSPATFERLIEGGMNRKQLRDFLFQERKPGAK